jgi:hypothetical protein
VPKILLINPIIPLKSLRNAETRAFAAQGQSNPTSLKL